jgi:hypothetical protein
VHDAHQVVAQLCEHRLVEVQVGAHQREDLRGGAGAGDRACRVPWHDEHEHEREQHDAEDGERAEADPGG